jgi:hypothetical protein
MVGNSWLFETSPLTLEYGMAEGSPGSAPDSSEPLTMRLIRCLAAGLVSLCLAIQSRAESPRPPLKLIHESTDLLLEVPDARQLVETLTKLYSLEQLKVFANYREFLGSTPVRRGKQLIAYLEKQLGAPWPELLDRLAGGGTLLAAKFGPNPAPALAVVQGRDEKLMTKFFQVGLDILDTELARQEGSVPLVRGQYQGLPIAHAGNAFWAGLAGSTLVLANSEKTLQTGLDRHLGKEIKSLADNKLIEESHALLKEGPLARLWVSLDAAHKSEQAKALYKMPRDDAQLTALFGSYIDLVGRSPYVCAGIYPSNDGFLATIRMPRGAEGMGADRLLHLPPAGKTATRPLLEPKDVLYSDSNYFNFAAIWDERARLFTAKQVKSLEEFNKSSAPFLLGNRMSDLLTKIAPYYRFVAVNQPKVSYKTTPNQIIPSFALVSELREPEAFGKGIGAVLRAGALLARTQVELKLVEEKCGDTMLVGWRFPEDQSFRNDTTNFRFNFSPCYARIGNQFLYCSTMELGREMVALLQREEKDRSSGEVSTTARSRFYSAGLAELLNVFHDQLVTRTILDQAARPDEAQGQIKALIDLVRRLGTFELSANYAAKDFHYDLRFIAGK